MPGAVAPPRRALRPCRLSISLGSSRYEADGATWPLADRPVTAAFDLLRTFTTIGMILLRGPYADVAQAERGPAAKRASPADEICRRPFWRPPRLVAPAMGRAPRADCQLAGREKYDACFPSIAVVIIEAHHGTE